MLSNSTAASLTLSIPTNYSNLRSVVLAAGQANAYGTFVKPSGKINVGFRNVAPATVPIDLTSLQILFVGPEVQLSWRSQAGLNYQPQWTANFQTWNNLTPGTLTGTGSNLTYVDVAPSTSTRFYRLRITNP